MTCRAGSARASTLTFRPTHPVPGSVPRKLGFFRPNEPCRTVHQILGLLVSAQSTPHSLTPNFKDLEARTALMPERKPQRAEHSCPRG